MSNLHEELRRVNIHERDFQKLSVDNRIYCVPVDEVCTSRKRAGYANGTSGRCLHLPAYKCVS
jgi:hypothetical protein